MDLGFPNDSQVKAQPMNGSHSNECGNGTVKNRRQAEKKMSMCSIKHVIHCLLMLTFMSVSVLVFLNPSCGASPLWATLGTWPVSFIYTIRILALAFALPYETFVFIGLFFYDTFSGDVELKHDDMRSYPFICFQVATRGQSPKLVRSTVFQNLKHIQQAGLLNFKLQVLTNTFVPGVVDDVCVSQMVVPADYETKSGALYKARSLQYAIEHDTLDDRDWLVHLDEETLLTPNSIRGILNFIHDGTHSFGQGAITYSNDGVENWITTLADATRVADDFGKIRAQFKLFHYPIFSMKGSYTVSAVGAERKVAYDNGPAGSIAEDCYFVMKAYDMGFTFDFIEGEMWEFSPFTVRDFVLQRKRWFQGILLVVYSGAMSVRSMIWLNIVFHNHFFLLLQPIFMLLDLYNLLPMPIWLQVLGLLGYGIRLYMYVFGILKSVDCGGTMEEISFLKLTGLSMLAVIFVYPIHQVMNILAIMSGMWSSKHGFYLVKKEI